MVWCSFGVLFGHVFQVGPMSFRVWLLSMQQFCERAGVLAITGSHDEGQMHPYSYSEQGKCLSVWHSTVSKLLGCSSSCLVTSPAGTQQTMLASQLHILGSLRLLSAVVPWYLFQKHCWHMCPLSSACWWCFKVGKTSLEEELVEETGAVFLAQSSEQFCSSGIGCLAWSHKFLFFQKAELWPRISTKNCQAWVCCEVIWSFLTQSSSPADFPHVLYLSSLPWLGLDQHSLFGGSYPDSVSLRGRSVATPLICCLSFAACRFWWWRVVSGLHAKNL